MKLQLEGQRLRFRIDEAELARLLAGDTLVDQTRLGPVQASERRLQLHDDDALALDWNIDGITLALPRAAVQDYVAGLPRRDALRLTLGNASTALDLDFEVDVRDSVRTRRPRATREA